jgi:hypothetical protein
MVRRARGHYEPDPRADVSAHPQARIGLAPVRSMARRRFTTWWSGVVVARIFLSPAAPQDRPWMWATGHNGDIKRAAFGYESVAALAH